MTEVNLMLGDCLDNLKTLEDNSVDSIVTDPPYGLSFMGKKWDYEVPSVAIWEECLRVLKPGGHLLAFAGTRTQHRMAVNIEDAGFEIRDMIAWVYGSGFPKSHNISKAIDKMAGAEREVVGVGSASRPNAKNHNVITRGDFSGDVFETVPATSEAQQWDGWGTALKPALEPITVARKPISEKTVAGNVLKYGTGGLNIDESRVGTEGATTRSHQADYAESGWRTGHKIEKLDAGRFPANLIHDGSEEVVELAGESARFFYCAKASKKDRDEGLDQMEEKQFVQWQTGNGASGKPSSMSEGRDTKRKNTHPTVKPTELMRYLVRLVTPKGGVVLDPFMGSGSTGKAVMLEGFNFLGMELDEDYMEIAKARIEAVRSKDDTR